ncbi:MAG: hypothetical protein AABX65_04240 [Nanoarchaeota archaeon]
MLLELSQLPTGSRIGIEDTEKKYDYVTKLKEKGLPIEEDKVARFYWEEIISFCKSRGLEVVYLDSDELYEKVGRIQHWIFQLKNAKKNKPSVISLKRKREIYSLETEVEYIFQVEREKSLIERIKETKLDVVLLGKAHTDYLRTNCPDGIKFNDYAAEKPAELTEELKMDLKYSFGEDWFNPLEDISPLENGFTAHPETDPLIIPQRTMTERKYKAIKEKRITNENPDFIGTWDAEIPLNGLFEIFI